MMSIRKLIQKRHHENESFKARMTMERAAQVDVAAKLRRLELTYKNKTRTQ